LTLPTKIRGDKMDNQIKKYLNRFKARVTEINEFQNITFLLKDKDIKYMLLEGRWRIFDRHKMVMTKSEFKKTEDIKDYFVGAFIKYIEISEFNDLKIVFDNHIILQIIADSMRFENWVLNQELICLPGGELTDVL
jgi:hypothetical protein